MFGWIIWMNMKLERFPSNWIKNNAYWSKRLDDNGRGWITWFNPIKWRLLSNEGRSFYVYISHKRIYLSHSLIFFWSRSKSILFFKEKFHSNAADMQTEEQEHASKLRWEDNYRHALQSKNLITSFLCKRYFTKSYSITGAIEIM